MTAKKPNLVDDGEGLLQTHVTWDMLEKAMQETYNTKATFGPEKSVKNLADGVGFSSIVALVDPDWQNSEGTEVPAKFVTKLATCVQGKKMSESMEAPEGVDSEALYTKWEILNRKLHNSEVEFYNYVKRNAECYEDFMIPKVIYTKRFDSSEDLIGFTIMEFLEDIEVLHLYHNVPADKIEQALRAIARIQAFSLRGDYKQQPDLNGNSFAELYNALLPCDIILHMMQHMKLTMDEKTQKLVDDVMEVAPDVYNFDHFTTECERRGMTKVFAHGDMWSTNVVWDKKTLDLRCLIDFQIVHLGSPAEDIARLLLTSMSGKERRENEERLLEKFYEDLEELLGDLPRPYTLEQLKENYWAVLPLSALLNAPMLGPVISYAIQKIEDENAKKQISELVLEKMTALFEDCVKYHKLNKD